MRHDHDPLRQQLILFSADPTCSYPLEMSGAVEESYDESDYSYEDEGSAGDDDRTNEDAIGLNEGDIQEAEVEASESESEEEGEEDDTEPAPLEYEPSFNRGPGSMDAREAGIVRNQVSNLQTSIKKRKVRDAIIVRVARGNYKAMKLLGGNGFAKGGYLINRNVLSKKGCPIGPKTEEARRAIYKEEDDKKAEGLEDFAKMVMPKYKVGKDIKKGKNNSPSMDPLKCLQAGFRGELQDMVIGPKRGANMAALGVKFVNSMVEKLDKCKPEGENATEEEVIAACQLSLLNAFTNNLDEATAKDFDPVNNDIHYDHGKEMKKRRRFED